MRCRGGVETSIEQVSRKTMSTDHVSRSCRGIETSEARDEARSIHQMSRSYRGVINFLDRSRRYRGADEIAIKKSLGSSTYSQLSRRCRGDVEPAFQNSFSRGEKHRHECNQVCNPTNDPNNILCSQKHLSTKIFKAHGSQKHTHTLNKSNQFYISKTSQDSLLSIH